MRQARKRSKRKTSTQQNSNKQELKTEGAKQLEIKTEAHISGKQVLITVKGFPMNTIKVTKWGILKGSQWRDRSQPAPAWGRYPPFIERKKSSSGEYDPVYMLTEDQAIEEIKKHINPEPGFGSRSRLKGFEKFAKVPVFNEVGIEYDDGTRGEDRARVLAAINVQKTMLEEQWAKAQKSMML